MRHEGPHVKGIVADFAYGVAADVQAGVNAVRAYLGQGYGGTPGVQLCVSSERALTLPDGKPVLAYFEWPTLSPQVVPWVNIVVAGGFPKRCTEFGLTRAEAVSAIQRACIHEFLHVRQWHIGGQPTNRGISAAATRLQREMLKAASAITHNP